MAETVTREMSTFVARDLRVQLKVAWVVAAISARFPKFACFVLQNNKSLMKSLNDWSLEDNWILLSSKLDVSRGEVERNIEILGKQNSLFPSGPVIQSSYFFI